MILSSINASTQSIQSFSSNPTHSSHRIEELREKQQEEQEKIASGKKINRAADDPSGMAIAEQILSSYNHLKGTSNNVASEINRIDTGDGALQGVQDSLSRMRELGIQASSSILSDSDRSIIQAEIDGLKEGIADITSNSEFNGQTLFDGTLGSLSLEELGIEDFDVTGDFSLDALDQAIDQVGSLQGDLGAERNGLEHEYNYTNNSALNQQSTYNQIMNTDIAESVVNTQVQQALSVYKYQAQNMMLSASLINLAV